MTDKIKHFFNLNLIELKSGIQAYTCRLCLINGADILIFDNKSVVSNMSDCNIVVLKDDGLPENICTNCQNKLQEAANFLNRCHENEKILRENHKLKITSARVNKENDYNHYDDCNANSVNQFNNTEYFDSDGFYDSAEDERRLMESIIMSESGEEYMYIAGVKVIVNRPETLSKGKVELRKKCRKKNVNITKTTKDMLCPICGKTSIKSLTAHMKLHGERIFSCEICAKSFPIRKKLTQHMLVHSNVREHQCEYCEKRFKTGSDKRKHINAMHREPLVLYPCIVCKKLFKKQQGLMEHMKVHTCEKNYECSVCHRKFAYKVTLTIHMRVHTGERPYCCSYCNKSFSASQTLREHVRIHTGEKPYDCPVCKKGFMQLSNMKSHFRNNHKGIEFKRKNIVKTYK